MDIGRFRAPNGSFRRSFVRYSICHFLGSWLLQEHNELRSWDGHHNLLASCPPIQLRWWSRRSWWFRRFDGMDDHPLPVVGCSSHHGRLSASILDFLKLSPDHFAHDPLKDNHARKCSLLPKKMEWHGQVVWLRLLVASEADLRLQALQGRHWSLFYSSSAGWLHTLVCSKHGYCHHCSPHLARDMGCTRNKRPSCSKPFWKQKEKELL